MRNKMMKKVSAFIGITMACATVVGVAGFANTKFAKAQNIKTEFSSAITAVSHAHGENINILPEGVRLWDASEGFSASYLNGLYEYSKLHQEFVAAVSTDNDRVREIYNQADAFNPVNNVLTWQSSLENVASYKVRVAYDNKFTQCFIIEDDADVEKGVTIENPLVGTDYYWQVIATLENGDKVYSSIFDFTTENSTRTVSIEGVSNTRDLGGYETAYGYVQQGLVYRSARLESITADGMYTLKNELGVKTDLDLRGEAEATTGANSKNPATLENYYTYDTPQYAYAANLGLDYEGHFANVGAIMQVFADKDNYPIDMHCAVGRDRTGTITALFKALLGYAEEDIVNDYYISMFSTTGAWSKETTLTNMGMINNVVSYLNSFNGATLADRAADYLISKCGMEQSDIDAIRNIMTGVEKVDIPAYETETDTDNYADCAFVTFEKFGTTKVLKVVASGETVEAPFAAGEGYAWTVNGQVYDFTAAVTEDMVVQATKPHAYEVTILSTGAITAQETVAVSEGAAFDFATLAKEGYDFVVISGDGKVITELTVLENTTLNVIYTKK